MPHASHAGDVLAGRYRLVDLLSESGQGRFWRARDTILARDVALHVIRADDARTPALLDAARRSAAVTDVRVLRVLDADTTDDPDTDGRIAYVVNEWAWGIPLDVVLAARGPLGARRSAWLVAEVSATVAAAHAVGVTHGRLIPENVMVDRTGSVRLAGLAVDAALHGLPAGSVGADVTDLGGLLYATVTGLWAGHSTSSVPPAPRAHGEPLRPRRVRAGVSTSLDRLCDEILAASSTRTGSHSRDRAPVDSAQAIAQVLLEQVDDPSAMPEALLASMPDVLPETEHVKLSPLTETGGYDPGATGTVGVPVGEPVGERVGEPGPDVGSGADPDEPRVESTQAGFPIFGEEDVSWLQRDPEPSPPPPPFEDLPERPLFAPDRPARDRPARDERSAAAVPSGGVGTGAGAEAGRRTGSGAAVQLIPEERAPESDVEEFEEQVPGRRFLRLAAVIVVLALLAVAVVVGVFLTGGHETTGRLPNTGFTSGPASSGGGSGGSGGGAGASGTPLDDVTATAFDPLGDGTENDADAALAVDGDAATAWSTQGYTQQLAEGGFKSGVGLLLDLGATQGVGEVDLTLVGSPTSVALYAPQGTTAPTDVTGLTPVATGSSQDGGQDGSQGTSLRLTVPAGVAPTRYLVVWLTSLPRDGAVYRGGVAEAVVRGR